MDANNIQEIKRRYKIVGNSDGLNRALDIATQVASTDLSVLIIGESGVGKEIIPRVIHDNSIRKHGKYIAINCGSIPEGTIDAELFGHSKGAFTGAIGEREGYFGAANKGTLFLDEVGELPLATQARLLRVLETGEYIRVGENEARKTDVRIIAATNVNMQKAMREGKFREDLYYRLNTIPINLPPLRDRGMDIEILFRSFARDIAEKYRLDPVRLTEDGKELLMAYKWPGNIRELRNVTEQISIISREREITSDILQQFGLTYDNTGERGLVVQNHSSGQKQQSEYSYENERDVLFHILKTLGNEVKELKEFIKNNIHQGGQAPTQESIHNMQSIIETPDIINSQVITNIHDFSNDVHITPFVQDSMPAEPVHTIEETPLTMREVERIKILEALGRNNNNRKKAAKDLGFSERTLYRKIKEYDINI